MKLLIKVATIIIIIIVVTAINSVHAAALWPISSVDTMKFSRDISREPDILTRIPKYVASVAKLSPTHIAIATPYNEEFYPVLSTWVKEARKYNMKVWFRGNWAEWEGWFGYKKFTDYKDHHQKTYDFILSHKELFEDGDIFTPAPEPENGGLGDPRGSSERTKKFQEFLITSYDTCEKARIAIQATFKCGYFSVNGDVARESLTKEVVAKTGKVVVIDHYVKKNDKLIQDIQSLHEKYDATIVLGEYGAPIPDIHGTMTEIQQADYIAESYAKVLSLGSIVEGINYWTAFGGSTKLFNDNGEERKAVSTIESFYNPPTLTGIITDQFGNKIENAKISVLDGALTSLTDQRGLYTIALPGTLSEVKVEAGKEFIPVSFELGLAQDIRVKNITLIRSTTSSVERIRLFFQGLFSKFGLFTG